MSDGTATENDTDTSPDGGSMTGALPDADADLGPFPDPSDEVG